MIRNVTLVDFKPGTTKDYIAGIAAAMARLKTPGLLHLSMGADLSLREGNMNYAVVADFVDAAAYRAFDEDPERARIWRDMTGPALARDERVQYEIKTPDAGHSVSNDEWPDADA